MASKHKWSYSGSNGKNTFFGRPRSDFENRNRSSLVVNMYVNRTYKARQSACSV